MASVFVQADDFSGAAEVGACFVRHGHTAQVLLGTSDDDVSTRGDVTDVVITDTHSRGLPRSAAANAAAQAFSSPAATNAGMVFKKVDSLWRGNISAEIAALSQLGYSVVVAGALPQLRRSVQHGKPFVDEFPLDRTDLWQAEQGTPPSSVAELIRPQAPGSVHGIGLDQVRSQLLDAILTDVLDAESPSVAVADGMSVSDLENVVDAVITLDFTCSDRRIALVGTGGLAEVLAQRLATRNARNAQSVATAKPSIPKRQEAPTPVLAVVGSASPTAQSQLSELAEDGFMVIRLDPRATGRYTSQLEEARHALRATSNVAVTLQQADVDPGRAIGIVRAIARFAADAARGLGPDLILTGGETAREVLDALGIRSMVPLAAVQHGAVLGLANDGTLVGTKPGSFGDHQALSQLHHEIQQRRGRPAGVPPTPFALRLPHNLEPT